MARLLRLEFPGAVYHVTSRGNARQDIVADDRDRSQWLSLLAHVVDRYGWLCYAYCLMDNHYHLQSGQWGQVLQYDRVIGRLSAHGTSTPS